MDISYPNAKINLTLYVTHKRLDGYHDIESLFYPIPCCDVLRFDVVEGSEDQWQQDGLACDASVQDNLVMRALKRMRMDCNIPPLSIHLSKHIPMGAGLGGGSADAAWMLKRLNAYFGLSISTKDLQVMAAELGSDCAFFIENKPAIATGRGECLQSVEMNLDRYAIALLCPSIHVSTKEAYGMIKPQAAPEDWASLIEASPQVWKELWRNDFEPIVATQHPILRHYKQTLYDYGASYAAMTGSGSTLFAFFEPSRAASFKTLEGLPIIWLNV